MNSLLDYQMKNLSIQTELLEALDWDDTKLDIISDIILEAETSKDGLVYLRNKITEEFDANIWSIVEKNIMLEKMFLTDAPEA